MFFASGTPPFPLPLATRRWGTHTYSLGTGCAFLDSRGAPGFGASKSCNLPARVHSGPLATSVIQRTTGLPSPTPNMVDGDARKRGPGLLLTLTPSKANPVRPMHGCKLKPGDLVKERARLDCVSFQVPSQKRLAKQRPVIFPYAYMNLYVL